MVKYFCDLCGVATSSRTEFIDGYHAKLDDNTSVQIRFVAPINAEFRVCKKCVSNAISAALEGTAQAGAGLVDPAEIAKVQVGIAQIDC